MIDKSLRQIQEEQEREKRDKNSSHKVFAKKTPSRARVLFERIVPGSRRAENPETPEVTLDPIEVRMTRASQLRQEPFVRDTLTKLAPRFEGFRNVEGLDAAGAVYYSNPYEIVVPPEPIEEQWYRDRLATHEFGHVMDFTDYAPPDLVNAVRKRFSDATSVTSIESPEQHFAEAYREAWDFVRGTGHYPIGGKFEWNKDDVDMFQPGASLIVDWLEAQGYKRGGE